MNLPSGLWKRRLRRRDLVWYGALVLLELIGVVAVLRPWSYRRSWRRAVAALGLFAPWTFIFLALLIHSGGIMLLHFFWLAGMCAWLVGLAFVSAIAALAARNGGVTEQAV